MPTINQLSAVDTVAAGDAIPLYSQAQGDARKSSITVLIDFIRQNLGIASGTSFTASSYLKVSSVTVANLPAAATAGSGARATVSDASQTLTAGIGGVVAGGGANIVPVFSDGTNWRIG